MKKFSNIPTNIITGFLGVGKTTVIRHLLKTKPAQEKWAVLVNEFGEVGIDGALLNGGNSSDDSIAVTEVPGGCMCCAVGLPSKVAMNKLIRQHQPDRILIEPTGLAHPKQVLEQFSGSEFKEVLDIQAVICLIDPWCLSDQRFSELPAFQDQIEMADILLATKSDLASPEHLKIFDEFCKAYQPAKQYFGVSNQGQVDWQLLTRPRRHEVQEDVSGHHHHHHHHHHQEQNQADIHHGYNDHGFVRIENQAEFGFSCGWRFDASWEFDIERLQDLLSALDVPRVKGVVASNNGWWAVNKMRTTVSIEPLAEAEDSRLEMIAMEAKDWQVIEPNLLSCRL